MIWYSKHTVHIERKENATQCESEGKGEGMKKKEMLERKSQGNDIMSGGTKLNSIQSAPDMGVSTQDRRSVPAHTPLLPPPPAPWGHLSQRTTPPFKRGLLIGSSPVGFLTSEISEGSKIPRECRYIRLAHRPRKFRLLDVHAGRVAVGFSHSPGRW